MAKLSFMFQVILSLPHILAFTAYSMLSFFSTVQIFARQWMTTKTMSLSCVLGGRTNTSQNIFSVSNCFQMIRVYTSAISTQMIDGKSFRNWANKQFIRKSMRQVFFAINNKNTITRYFFNRCLPFPTTIGHFLEVRIKVYYRVFSWLTCSARNIMAFYDSAYSPKMAIISFRQYKAILPRFVNFANFLFLFFGKFRLWHSLSPCFIKGVYAKYYYLSSIK